MQAGVDFFEIARVVAFDCREQVTGHAGGNTVRQEFRRHSDADVAFVRDEFTHDADIVRTLDVDHRQRRVELMYAHLYIDNLQFCLPIPRSARSCRTSLTYFRYAS